MLFNLQLLAEEVLPLRRPPAWVVPDHFPPLITICRFLSLLRPKDRKRKKLGKKTMEALENY